MATDIAALCYIVFIAGIGSGVFYYNTAYTIYTFPKSGMDALKIIQLLKIVFNFTGGIRLNFEIIYFMLPPDITDTTCKAIAFTHAVVFLIYRTSLMLCLFYKVRLLYKKLIFFGLLLIFIRIGFHTVYIILLKPGVENTICKPNLTKNLITIWGFIGTDFLIELYLAYKVIILMNDAKKDNAISNQSSRKNNSYTSPITSTSSAGDTTLVNQNPLTSRKGSNAVARNKNESYGIFNAVIFWCILRIIMAVLLNLVTALDTANIHNLHMTIIPTLNFVICVAMSNVLTYDKDIINFVRSFNMITFN